MLGNKKLFVPLIEGDGIMHFYHTPDMADFIRCANSNLSKLTISREPSKTFDSGEPRPNLLGFEQPLDLILVPGLAFDAKNRRLGRGKGFYDR
jgi:5-formyltetrahydrofolate cyclo-ligase